MRSELQREASRINGAKSRGPITPEGKRKSSLNAIRREMLSRTVLIKGESPAQFDAIARQLWAEYRPLPGTETALIESMAVARWRTYRLWRLEAAALGHEARNHRSMAGNKDADTDDIIHLVYGARNLTDHSRLLDYLTREQSRCEMQYARAHRALLAAQSRRGTNLRRVPHGLPEAALSEATENTTSGEPPEPQDPPETNPSEPKPNRNEPEEPKV